VRGFKFQRFRGDLKPSGFKFHPFKPSPNNKEWILKPQVLSSIPFPLTKQALKKSSKIISGKSL